jgi:transposase-like protein
MPEKRRKFSPQFKAEAVQMAIALRQCGARP